VYIIAMRDRRAGAAAGATSVVTLNQVVAPAVRQNGLERLQRRARGCDNLESSIAGIQGATIIDLGRSQESELSAVVRESIAGVRAGDASPVVVNGDQASFIVVCARETGGAGVPERDEIEARLREQEMTMLSDRYLRNLRREATIITRAQ
jgi:peptidyl-prolyl cis-trans isomerase SurA